MWKHPSTQSNIEKLNSYGNIIIKPVHGELASGLIGEGRMSEPEDIIEFLQETLEKNLPLKNKKALVTAGPTYEAIDPVRFIGNHSSGKMGFALAEELSDMGAEVTLISGPTSLSNTNNRIKRIDITSAEEMNHQVNLYFPKSDITIMSAAVADYRPEKISAQKIKKNDESLVMALEKTPDILSNLGAKKKPGQILIGFALETTNEETNAIKKIRQKNLDFIVLNSLNDKGAGFKSDTNKITIIDHDLHKEYFPVKSKKEVAADICRKILTLLS
jgi:phosphopantothenoylcysteine decarboxylase/phosphopantothenate--cysteine ligase